MGLIEPNLRLIHQTAYEHIQVAITIEVAQGWFGGIVPLQPQAAVAEITTSIVEPHLIGQVHIGNEHVRIPVQIEITDGHIRALGFIQRLTAVGELTSSIVQEVTAGETSGIMETIEHQSIEITIAIEIGQGDTAVRGLAVIHFPAFAELPDTVIELHHVPLAPTFAEIIHIAVPVQISPGDGFLVEGQAAITKVRLTIVEVHFVRLTSGGVINHMHISVPVSIEIKQIDLIGADARIAQILFCVRHNSVTVVEIDAAGRDELMTGNKSIGVAIQVEVGQANAMAVLGQLLAGVDENAAAIVQPDL
jgi:hypothetical protein